MRAARIAEITVGYTGNWLMVKGFDLVLYPLVIFKLGILRGGVVMALLSFVICLLTLRFYDWSKRDWLGIEAIKGMKEYEGNHFLGRCTAWMLRRSDWLACLLLSVKTDPFITTTYLRVGAFSGMSRRDWKIFVASWFISNLYWTFVCFGGVSLLVGAYRAVRGW